MDANTGEEIHERVVMTDRPSGYTFSVPDPEIPGYVSIMPENFAGGTITNGNITLTRLYVPVTVPGGGTPGEPGGEGEPEPPLRLFTLVDIADLETPLGLGGLNVNVGECIE